MMTRELKDAVEAARRVGLRRLKRRKWPRWLVPNCISKPSTVVLPGLGMAMTPALQMRIANSFSFFRNSCALFRTEAREERSCSMRKTRSEVRMSPRASRALGRSRAVRYSFAPVRARDRAVSTPRPEEQPVMKMVLPVSLPSIASSAMIWLAVGRASPGP